MAMEEGNLFEVSLFGQAVDFLINYGWYMLGGLIAATITWSQLQPWIKRWQQAREDAYYHKNPDIALARIQAIERARLKQQMEVEASSIRKAEIQKEREELKRVERQEKLAASQESRSPGHVLGTSDKDKEVMRLEAIQRAREKQQRELEAASIRNAEAQKQREELKKAELAERLAASQAGRSTRGPIDDGYLPLMGGGTAGGYRPPKRSKCGGGGCGK